MTELVTVCDACLRSRCWQGEGMCRASQDAGTVEKTIAGTQSAGP